MVDNDGQVRVIDFGVSKAVEAHKKLKTMTQAPEYLAPEAIDGHYDSKADMWSLGVLLYTVISGYQPFKLVGNLNVFYKQLKLGRYHFEHPEFKTCSPEVIDLIKKLLDPYPKRRLSAAEALAHPWFAKAPQASDGVKIDKEVLMRLKEFQGQSKLRKAAMHLMVKKADQSEMMALNDQFFKLDKDNTGVLNAGELKAALKASKVECSDAEIDQIISEVDVFGNG